MRRLLGAWACVLVLAGLLPFTAAGDDAVGEQIKAGRKHLEQGQVAAAIAAFQKAAALDPTDGAAQLNLGAAYERANKPDEAIGAYRKSAELEPKNLFAHNNLGVLLDRKGAYDQAIAAFQNALKSEPGNVMAQKNLATAKKNKEVVKKREDDLARAEKDAQAKPEDPQLAYQAARAYAFYGKKEAAIQWLNKAIKLGFKDRNSIKSDPAFVTMRDERELELLLQQK